MSDSADTPRAATAVEQPLGLPWLWSGPPCPEVPSLLGPCVVLEPGALSLSWYSRAPPVAMLGSSLCRLAGLPAFHASLVLMIK